MTRENIPSKTRVVHVIEQRLSKRHKWHPWNVFIDRDDVIIAMDNIIRANGLRESRELFRVTKYVGTEP